MLFRVSIQTNLTPFFTVKMRSPKKIAGKLGWSFKLRLLVELFAPRKWRWSGWFSQASSPILRKKWKKHDKKNTFLMAVWWKHHHFPFVKVFLYIIQLETSPSWQFPDQIFRVVSAVTKSPPPLTASSPNELGGFLAPTPFEQICASQIGSFVENIKYIWNHQPRFSLHLKLVKMLILTVKMGFLEIFLPPFLRGQNSEKKLGETHPPDWSSSSPKNIWNLWLPVDANIAGNETRRSTPGSKYMGGFLKWWVSPTTIGFFLTINDHVGVWNGGETHHN